MASVAIADSASQLGATLVPGGAVFRLWAPRATSVSVIGDFNAWDTTANPMQPSGGRWTLFVPGLTEGSEYLYWVDGEDGPWHKRDPHARELTFQPAFPNCNCVLHDPSAFPWHDTGYQTPPFHELVCYQLHIGTFRISPEENGGRFVDVVRQLPYLASLGVNALQLMPIVEFPTTFSLGYNGTDYFSAENDYGEEDAPDVQTYFDTLNALLAQRGQLPYPSPALLRGSANQLRAMVDLCHVFGLAVLLDVVYNHAGGGFDPASMYFLDRQKQGDNNDSLYFTDQGWAGGLVFAYWNADVRRFLNDNARMFLTEYRVDGFRFDEVSVMDHFGGWSTCQEINAEIASTNSKAIRIAEYWPVNGAVTQTSSNGGAGFDATWSDRLRDAVRSAVGASSAGMGVQVNLDAIADALRGRATQDFWRQVNCLENHDIVKFDRGPRIPALADPSNSRSWYARSRSRWALGLLATAPGIPMLFMGQEFLEDKRWNDDPVGGSVPSWDRLESGVQEMIDFLRFTQEILGVRHRQSALQGEGLNVFHVHNVNRVLAFQRWVPGEGRDVVVVASLNESTFYGYDLGFPGNGRWLEVFNSDIYDNWVNPIGAGNGGQIDAQGGPMHGLPSSASIVIPANSILIFARD